MTQVLESSAVTFQQNTKRQVKCTDSTVVENYGQKTLNKDENDS